MKTGQKSAAVCRMTAFAPATDLRAGDVVLDEDGEPREVTAAAVDGDRIALCVGGVDMALTADDIVEQVQQ